MTKKEKILDRYINSRRTLSLGERKKICKELDVRLARISDVITKYENNRRVQLKEAARKEIREGEDELEFNYDIEESIKHICVDTLYHNFQRFHSSR